ncbi:E3 ubiquitin-protein ligase RNF31 isoform X1 [Rhipicephalus microplus]|uniref:E3 ubiquitin-protein ligase RNF31 isoform X1 n=1 Tax=Rhipicephalus microplus TaxID=6941 RepID=UPI003F6B6FA6
MGGFASSVAFLHQEAAGNMEPPRAVINVQITRMAGIITEHARNLITDREVCTFGEGILAVLLTKMGYDKDKALRAAREKESIRSALFFLKDAVFKDCVLCYHSFLESDLTQNKLIPCGHTACANCLKTHFWTQVHRGKLSCIECSAEVDQSLNINVLKRIFGEEYASFDHRLLLCCLEQTGEEKYCANKMCGMMLSVPRELWKMQCPSCKTIACTKCGNEWRKEHENRSCDDFMKWKSENDPDDPEYKLQDLIRRTAIMCPHCKTQYFKAKGGCAHFTCRNCKRAFCECCKTEFWTGQACGNEDCKGRGLHGHHPRNCFYYTRDYPCEDLQKLLEDAGVPVDEMAPQVVTDACTVSITSDDYSDSACGLPVLKGGKCEKHYKEILCDLIYRHRVDVLNLFNQDKLENELKKHKKDMPQLSSDLSPDEKLIRLCEFVAQAVPLAP